MYKPIKKKNVKTKCTRKAVRPSI